MRFAASLAFVHLARVATAQTLVEPVDLVRDAEAVPHVWAQSEAGAMYGLGYASAEDRLFQMEFARRVMRGRMAEILDPAQFPGALPLDRRARYLGWGAHADRLAAALAQVDPATYALLDAYCGGVNAKLGEIRSNGAWPSMFTSLALAGMADWTPADCLLAWLRVVQLFDGPIGAELAAEQSSGGVCAAPILFDADGAVVRQAWTQPLCLDDLRAESRPLAAREPQVYLTASHNLAIHGSRTASGLPLLLGKPQHRVFAPNFYYEFALRGGAFDCRGVGVAGCPGLVHGWNRDVAWSFTSLGGDQRDLYRLQLSATKPDAYWLDGHWRMMSDVRDEVIAIRGGGVDVVRHRETMWGPEVSDWFADEDPSLVVGQTEGYAFRSVSLTDRSRHSVQAMFDLMRASDWCEARDAMRKWRGPGVHFLCADSSGNIGYTAAVVLPKRPANAPCAGDFPLDGTTSASRWLRPIAFDYLPWVENPPDGFIATANNLAAAPEAISDWILFGTLGDTQRSWRLREHLTRLVGTGAVTANDVLDLDRDCQDPLLRELAGLVEHLHASQGFAHALEPALSSWNCDVPAVGCWDVSSATAGYETLLKVSRAAPRIGKSAALASLVAAFGDGASGVSNMLKTADAMGLAAFVAAYPAVVTWVQARLDLAAADTSAGPDPFTVYYQNNLEPGLFSSSVHSLDPSAEFDVSLVCPSAHTIWSQSGESYVFLADLSDADSNRALLPPGVSEDPASGSFLAHVSDWTSGTLYSAPLTRDPSWPSTTIYYVP